MSKLFVSQLFYYPLKSARGIASSSLVLDGRGPQFDRRWVLVDEKGKFVSQRSLPTLGRLKVEVTPAQQLFIYADDGSRFEAPLTPESSLEVQIWQDRVMADDCGDEVARWLSEQLKTELRLAVMPERTKRRVDPEYASPNTLVGFADGFPLLIVTQSALDHLNTKLDHAIGMERFRPNIVINGAPPHAEDHWREIKIGDVQISLVKPCARCIIPSIDPATAKPQAEVIPTLGRYRRQGREINFGMNAIHHLQNGQTAQIEVGDRVEIIG